MSRKRTPLPPKPEPRPLPEWQHVMVEWRWVEPEGYTGDGDAEPRLLYRRVVTDDGLTDELRREMRHLRALGLYNGPLLGDELSPPEGATRRGVPADYAGDDERLCNARCVAGRPCRALALENGRCVRHGGKSSGPRTSEGKRRSAANLIRAREVLAARRAVPRRP